MPKKISFEVEIDANGARSGLARVEALAKESDRRMALTKKTFGELPTIDPATGMIGGRGKGGGRFGQFGASTTMFVSATRDAFASLASGANPITVFLQQAPQVAQAFTMMGQSALKAAKGILMLPVTWLIAGLVAVVATLYYVGKHFADLSRGQETLRKLMDLTKTTFAEQVEVMKDANKASRDQVEWNKKHAQSQKDLADETRAALSALKEKAGFEQQLATARGASKQKLAQMELEQARAELALLEAAAKKAQAQYSASRQQLTAASDAKDEFGGFGEKSRLEKGKNQLEEAAKLIKEIEEKMKTTTYTSQSGAAVQTPYGLVNSQVTRKATASDMMTTSGGTMSLEQAVAKYRELEAIVTELEFKESQINDLLKEKQNLTDDQKKTLDQLIKDRDAAAASLKIKEQFLPAIARAGGLAGSGVGGGDSLVRVGNFLGTTRGKIESIAQRSMEIQQRYLPLIEANTRARSSGTYPIN